jgi:hypothetical protein
LALDFFTLTLDELEGMTLNQYYELILGQLPQATTVRDIRTRRINGDSGNNPARFVELLGGKLAPVSNYEPDPQTSRIDYYYNTRINKLFRRAKIEGEDVDVFYWKSAATS